MMITARSRASASFLAFLALWAMSPVMTSAMGLGHRTRQRLQENDSASALKEVEAYPDQPLRVVGEGDCPLAITSAAVKEIPGYLFTRLTGKETQLAVISSVPEVTVVNNSKSVVTSFAVMVRDPNSRTTMLQFKSRVAIKPGDSYTLKRELFGPVERTTVATEGGVTKALPDAGLRSEKKWIQFAPPESLYVVVGRVGFETRSTWTIKDGGDVR